MNERIWCFDDSHHWGRELAATAQRRAYDVHMFDSAGQPDYGYLFMHMHHHPNVRAIHKRMMQHFATKPELTCVPDYRSSVLYDDKLEQLRSFARWMPKTRVFRSPSAARRFIDEGPQFPFISKTSEGAGSHNVRLIRTVDEARREVKLAFSDLGIKCRYEQRQHGYLYWQELVEGNKYDLRIISCGKQRLILKRFNRQDVPFASGSGKFEAIKELDGETASALNYADCFFNEERQPWCGIDLVHDDKGKWYLLETTVGWKMSGYFDCRFFPDGRNGKQFWDVFLDELEQGAFR